jgi:MYXO-CTERM domain-containing protein
VLVARWCDSSDDALVVLLLVVVLLLLRRRVVLRLLPFPLWRSVFFSRIERRTNARDEDDG